MRGQVGQSDNLRKLTSLRSAMLPLPAQMQPKVLQGDPWPAQCQWYFYSATGQLKSIDRLRGPCEVLTRSELAETMQAVAPVVSWQYSFSVPYQKGVVVVSRSDVKEYGELWEPQIVVKPFTREGVEFKAGDLLLYMSDLKARKIAWIRHLRKVE